jgi:hypothetical protein
MFSRIFRPKSAGVISVTLCFAPCGCSGTDIGYPRVSDAVSSCPDVAVPVAGTGSGGSNGASNGGSLNGGSPTGAAGSGVAPTAGADGSAGSAPLGGAPVTTPFVWPSTYDATAMPMPADGAHNPGTGCMASTCHGSKVPFAFGGTVYKAGAMTGAPNVEVGISDGVLTVTAYSASNGNIWLPGSVGAINFSAAQIVIRNANGERVKAATAPRGAACNGSGCHNATMRLLEP